MTRRKTVKAKCSIATCVAVVEVSAGTKFPYCVEHMHLSRPLAQKRYCDRNRDLVRKKNRGYKGRYARTDTPVDRGKTIMIYGWTLSLLTYEALVGRFGQHWVREYCAELATRRRASKNESSVTRKLEGK